MATRKYEGKKFEEGQSSKINDALTLEAALQININNEPFTISMRTPGEDESLVRGLLHSEDVVKDLAFIPELSLIRETEALSVVNVVVPENLLGPGYSNSRSLLSVSSCGICGKTSLDEDLLNEETIKDSDRIDVLVIRELFEKMRSGQNDFDQSGGTHAAAVFSLDGELLCTMEDIGRHNAVDKIIGNLIILKSLEKAKIMTVSGRISYEIVVKCFKAGIPFLAAVSAPSSLAVDYAKELGITLFAFCRGQRATCYSNAQRTMDSHINTKAH